MDTPDCMPLIPEDRVASDIWGWHEANLAAFKGRSGGISYCRALADYLRLRGHIKESR